MLVTDASTRPLNLLISAGAAVRTVGDYGSLLAAALELWTFSPSLRPMRLTMLRNGIGRITLPAAGRDDEEAISAVFRWLAAAEK
jgi:hypothetical protein